MGTLTRRIVKSIDCTKPLNFEISKDFDGLKKLDTDLYARVTDKSITVVSSEPIKLGDEGDCRRLFNNTNFISIDFKNTDTSEVTNMAYMFYDCKAKSLNLSDFDTSKVTNMRSVFSCCKVESLNLSSFVTSNVNNMNSMFFCCEVKSLDLRSFNTSKTTNMNYMFYRCKTGLLNLSSFDTSNVTDMSYMFSCCEVASLDLSNFNTSKVTNMSYMFYGCQASLIDLSDFVIREGANANGMFTNSTSFFIRKQVTLTRGLVENLDTFKELEFKVHSEIEKAVGFEQIAFNMFIKETPSTITIASSRPIKLESKPNVLFNNTNFTFIDLTNTEYK